MDNGLTERDVNTITGIFLKFPQITRVVVFGSRAKGNYKPGSDIDLAIMNEGVTDDIIRKVHSEFESSNLPYFVDIINYPTLNHKELKEHIDRVGIVFYSVPFSP